jgi:predicted DNA binding CopG/RHH family protein
MKRISLMLPPKQIAALKKIAAKTGIPLSEIIRRAIDEFISKNI